MAVSICQKFKQFLEHKVEILSSISGAIEIAKKLRVLGQKVGDADFKMLLADLTDQLGDAKLEAANLKIELAEKTSRITELERQTQNRQNTEPDVHEGAYVFGDLTRHFCTGCYDTARKKILLTEKTGHRTVFGKWSCPACNQSSGPSTR
jgi:hypothetical protein